MESTSTANQIDQTDVLVCLTIETTHDSTKYPTNYRRIYGDDTLAKLGGGAAEQATLLPNIEDAAKNTNFPNLVQMDW
jgi:hypothetical protein